jgi:histidyl-tRNA synthetase
MGGPDTPGTGWAAGIERLAMLLDATPATPRPVAVVPIGAPAEFEALRLAEELRAAGVVVELDFRGKVGQRLKRAAHRHARFALLLGEDELAKGTAILRNLDQGEQTEVARADLVATLAEVS